jgi:N-acetylglucosamine-6-sulfatase
VTLRRSGRLSAAALVVVGLVLAALAPGDLSVPAAGPVATSHGARPNVVLIVTDDQRADSLAGMTKVNSMLADQGVRFTNGMVPTSLCCPSRSTILTGLYSHHTRVFGNGDVGGSRFGGWAQFHRRGMEYRTIATALAGRGYRTGFFGKYLNDFSTLSPDGYTPPGWDTFTAFKYSRGAYFGYRLTDGTYHGTNPHDYSTDVLARRAKRFVRNTPDDQPLFVLFAPYGPHSPYVPAPRDATRAAAIPATLRPASVAPGAAGAATATGPAPAVDTVPRWQLGRQAAPGDAEDAWRGQTATLLSVDDAVASIVRTMRREDRERDTLFVFMSDNGYLWGEHGLVGKDAPYDAATRVPLVIRWDGHAPSGVVDDRLALNVDIAGTIATAAGASMRTDGLDLLDNRTRSGFPLEAMAGYHNRPAYCGWRTVDHMYVRYATGRTELYDYRTDPSEMHNLAGDPALADLQTRMRAKATEHCSPQPPGFDW